MGMPPPKRASNLTTGGILAIATGFIVLAARTTLAEEPRVAAVWGYEPGFDPAVGTKVGTLDTEASLVGALGVKGRSLVVFERACGQCGSRPRRVDPVPPGQFDAIVIVKPTPKGTEASERPGISAELLRHRAKRIHYVTDTDGKIGRRWNAFWPDRWYLVENGTLVSLQKARA